MNSPIKLDKKSIDIEYLILRQRERMKYATGSLDNLDSKPSEAKQLESIKKEFMAKKKHSVAVNKSTRRHRPALTPFNQKCPDLNQNSNSSKKLLNTFSPSFGALNRRAYCLN